MRASSWRRLNQGEPADRLEPQAEAVDDDKASEIGPIPIDTTAEPLGRAKPRPPRAGVGAATPAAAGVFSTRKTTPPKKPAARTTTRSRKPVRSDSGGKNES